MEESWENYKGRYWVSEAREMGMRKPYKHQIDGIKFLVDNFKRENGSILSYEMGLGKTYTSLLFYKILRERTRLKHCLIVVPRSLFQVWREEIVTLFGFEPQIYKTGKKKPLSGEIVLTTYDLLKKEQTHTDIINPMGKYLLILDEAHEYCTKTKSGRWQAVKKLKPANTLLLTGTPIYNKYEDLYGLISLVHPELAGSKEDWCRKFIRLEDRWIKRKPYKAHSYYQCEGKCVYKWAKEIKPSYKFWACPQCNQRYLRIKQIVGYREENIPALTSLLSQVMLRKLKKDCLDLPPKKIIYLPYELNTTKAQYRQWEEEENTALVAVHKLLMILSGSA